ncbi:hypothetical protein J6590_001047, partial [Homalodisca vitripennis]
TEPQDEPNQNRTVPETLSKPSGLKLLHLQNWKSHNNRSMNKSAAMCSWPGDLLTMLRCRHARPAILGRVATVPLQWFVLVWVKARSLLDWR